MTGAHTRRGRVLPALVAVVLVAALLPATAWADAREVDEDLCAPPYEADFDDIAGSAHEEMVRCLADHGLAEGVGDGSRYAPRRDVTRGQMASFIARALEDYAGEALPEGDPARFDDVPEEDDDYPHASSIHSLAEIEVVAGTSASDGDAYAPEDPVTRGQTATMIRRALAWLDNGDARDGSAPPDAEESAFTDTAGSGHESNIDAIAAVGIVQGRDDGTYRPRNHVKRDQMASFVMRSYDYAVSAGLGDGDEEPEPVRIVSPTTSEPAYPLAGGDEIDITFTTQAAGAYALAYRDPDDSDGGAWTAFGGEQTSGEVASGDTHEVTVTLPEEETEEGVRDLRLTFTADATPDTTVTNRQEEALVVADGVVVNTTQEQWHFAIQDAVDAAEDDDILHAVGSFEEVVEIAGVDGLLLAGTAETELAGSLLIDGTTGTTVSELTLSAYEPVGSDLPLPTGEPTGIAVTGGATEVTLTGLTLSGAGADSDDYGVVVGEDAVAPVEVSESVFVGNDIGVVARAPETTVGPGNHFEANRAGVWFDGAAEDGTVTGSVFRDNHMGLQSDAVAVRIEANEFHGHVEPIRLIEDATFAEVVDNLFAADNGEYLRFHTGDYHPTDFPTQVAADNDLAEPAETVEENAWTILRPQADETSEET